MNHGKEVNLKEEHDEQKIEWISFIRQLFISSGVWTYYFMFGLSFGAPTVIIPQIKREVNSSFVINVEMESWLSSTLGFSGLPCAIIISASAYIVGRKMTCVFMSLATVLGFLVFYFSTKTEHLLISQVIHGPLTASQVTTSWLISSEYVSPQYRGMFFAAQLSSMFWGIWVSNAIGTFVHWKIIGLFGLIISIYSVISVLIVWPESPYWLSIKGRMDECVKSHRWLKGISENAEKELNGLMNLEKESDAISIKQFIKEHTCDFFRVIWLPEVYKALAFCLLFMSMYHSSGKIVYSIYSIDIVKKITKSEHVAYIAMLIIDGVTVVGMYSGCFLVKYFKRRTLLIVLSLLTIVFLYSISLYLYLIHLAVINENVYFTISLLVVFSLTASVGPISVTCTTFGEMLPLKSRSICVCLLSFYAKFGTAITLKITPYLFKAIQLHGTFCIFGILSSICLFLVYKYLPESKDLTLIEVSELLRGSIRRIDGNKEFRLVKSSDEV